MVNSLSEAAFSEKSAQSAGRQLCEPIARPNRDLQRKVYGKTRLSTLCAVCILYVDAVPTLRDQFDCRCECDRQGVAEKCAVISIHALSGAPHRPSPSRAMFTGHPSPQSARSWVRVRRQLGPFEVADRRCVQIARLVNALELHCPFHPEHPPAGMPRTIFVLSLSTPNFFPVSRDTAVPLGGRASSPFFAERSQIGATPLRDGI